MGNFLEEYSNEITFIIVIILIFTFISIVIKPRYEYALEIEYKNKIIERELGRNFESYEDYLVWRIERGE